MLQDLWEIFRSGIGINEVEPVMSTWQMIPRTIVVYVVALLLIRIGKRRFLGGYTTFDILLGFVVGSVMSRAITGTITLVNMFFVVATLVGIHWIIAIVTYYFDTNNVVKNSERQLIKDGEIDQDAMQESKLGENDLLQALREKANVESLDKVKSAYLERDGSITVIPNGCETHVVEVDVKEGVQSIKIVIEH
ncbi:hypothetical protein BH20ACI1_BH20ACI1_04920 [soil metagenome]